MSSTQPAALNVGPALPVFPSPNQGLEIVEAGGAREAVEAEVRALLRESRASIRDCVYAHAEEIGFIIGAQDADDVQIKVSATAKQWKIEVHFSSANQGPRVSACIRTRLVARLNNIAPSDEVEGLIVWRPRLR